MMLLTKYQGSQPYGFRQDFSMFFNILAYLKHVTPGAGPFFGPRHIICTDLVVVH